MANLNQYLVQLTVIIGERRVDTHTLVSADTTEEAGVFAICVEAYSPVNFSSNDQALTRDSETGYEIRRITHLTQFQYLVLKTLFSEFYYDEEVVLNGIETEEGYPPCLSV